MNITTPAYPVPTDPFLTQHNELPEAPVATQDAKVNPTSAMTAPASLDADATVERKPEEATTPRKGPEQWRATGDEWAATLRDGVRERPLTSLAAALAVGVVISRLTR